jgi:hypothetical protein
LVRAVNPEDIVEEQIVFCLPCLEEDDEEKQDRRPEPKLDAGQLGFVRGRVREIEVLSELEKGRRRSDEEKITEEELRRNEIQHEAMVKISEFSNSIVPDEECAFLILAEQQQKQQAENIDAEAKDQADREHYEAGEAREKKVEESRLDELELEADTNWEWFVDDVDHVAENERMMAMVRRINAQNVEDVAEEDWFRDEEMYRNDPWYARRLREHEEAEAEDEMIDNHVEEEAREEEEYRNERDRVLAEEIVEQEETQEVFEGLTSEEEIWRMMFDEEAKEHRMSVRRSGEDCHCLMCLGASDSDGGAYSD